MRKGISRHVFTRIGVMGIVLLFPLVLFSQQIRVRVYYNKDISFAAVSSAKVPCTIIADHGTLLESSEEFGLKAAGDTVQLYNKAGKVQGLYSFVSFVSSASPGAQLKLVIHPGGKIRTYKGNLTVTASGGQLNMVNEVDIESYIGGVISAEVGSVNAYEFKKLKAIIIRTYALSNLYKHVAEGFNLCDRTHCQVYNGLGGSTADIAKAVKDTKGMVLVDDSIRLISASFFSNCGGQTCNSEDVWTKPYSYLVSVPDSFCMHKTSARWTRKISRKDWLAYFEKKFNYPVKDTSFVKQLLNFEQPSRKKYLVEEGFCIPLRTIREDWNLRSTFFSVRTEGDLVFLAGRGFGHGVGLCQEGAMEMAAKGYTVMQIISHYYKKAMLVDLSRLDFYRYTDAD